jgi:hypothetical protein
MEPITLAASAAALLTPYFVKAAGKAAETIGEKTAEAMPAAAGRLWQAITARFSGKPAAEEAVKDLAANPRDEDNVASFRKELKKALEADAQFADELGRLLTDVQRESGQIIYNIGPGAVATSGGVAAGQGGIAIGGDVHGNVSLANSDPKK